MALSEGRGIGFEGAVDLGGEVDDCAHPVVSEKLAD